MKEKNSHQTGHIFRSGRFWYGRWREKHLSRMRAGNLGSRASSTAKSLPSTATVIAPKVTQIAASRCEAQASERRRSAEATLTVAEYGASSSFPTASANLNQARTTDTKGFGECT